ncbi:hypothetical protein DKT67_00300 [Enterococcus faecium]|nr:hypothetical protein DKT67_00300 [Enterococcus faecium]
MATNESLKNQLAAKPQKQVAPGQLGLKALMNTPTMRKKFEEVLHDNANAFMSNVMTLVSNDSYLADSEPMSIMSGALTAATLNLGLDKNLKAIQRDYVLSEERTIKSIIEYKKALENITRQFEQACEIEEEAE